MNKSFSSWCVFKCEGCVCDISFDSKEKSFPYAEKGICKKCGSDKWKIIDGNSKTIRESK